MDKDFRDYDVAIAEIEEVALCGCVVLDVLTCALCTSKSCPDDCIYDRIF